LRQKELWRSVFGLEQTVIERVFMDHDQGVIILPSPPAQSIRSRPA